MENSRPFYRIIERRLRNYKESEEFLVQWSETHTSTQFTWVSYGELLTICSNDKLNDLIMEGYNEWYRLHRWGNTPNRYTATHPIEKPLYTIADNQELFMQGYGSLDLDEPFDRILSQTMNKLIMNSLFDFSTGFNDTPKYPIESLDRKLVELDFIYNVFKSWLEHIDCQISGRQQRNTFFQLLRPTGGSNTWFDQEYEELLEATKQNGFGRFLQLRSASEFKTYIPERQNVVFLYCESNAFIPNAYSVVARRRNFKRKFIVWL